MSIFSDLLRELAPDVGKGLEAGIEEEHKLGQQERGFARLAPLRQQQRLEEEEFTVRGEQRKAAQAAAQQEALAGELGSLAQSLGLPVPTGPARVTPGPPAMADILREPTVTPGKPRLPKEGIPLLTGMLRGQQRTQRAPTMTELFIAAAEEREAGTRGPATKALEAGAGFAGAQTGARQQAMPLPAGIQEDISDLEGSLRRIQSGIRGGTPEETRQRVATYLSPQRGATAGVRGALNQLSGGALMDPNEQSFRATVLDIQDMLLRARSGAQINEQEFRRLSKIAPSLNMAPENFLQRLDEFEREFEATIKRKRELATTPRGAAAPRPGWTLVEE